MGTIYFLIFIAACALGFVWLIRRSGKAREASRRPNSHSQHRHTRPLYQHKIAGHSLLHTHTGDLPSETRDVWHNRRPMANKEHWLPNSTVTATHLRSDEEPMEDSEEEMTMSTIEYVPEEFSEAGGKG